MADTTPTPAPNPLDAFMAKAAAIPASGDAPAPPAPDKPADPVPTKPAKPADPVKPAEPAPGPDPAKLSFDKPTKSDQWKEVKAAREAAERRAAELEAKLAKLGDVDTLLKAQQELVETRQRLREVAIERDPEFQRQFNDRRGTFIAQAKDAVGPELAPEVERILDRYGAAATPRIKELVTQHSLDAFAQTQLAAAVAGLSGVENERSALVKRAAENWDKNVTEQTLAAQRAAEQAAQSRIGALEAALKEHASHPLLAEREGDDEHNAAVRESLAVAKRVASLDLEPDELAQVALMGATYPQVLKGWQAAEAKVAELTEQLNSLRGAQPRGEGGKFAAKTPPGALPPALPKPGEYDPTLTAANLWNQRVREAGL